MTALRVRRQSGPIAWLARAVHLGQDWWWVWLRLALAIWLVAHLALFWLLPIGGGEVLALYVPLAVLAATPLVPFHATIVRPDAPFFRRGYLAVAALGPLLLIALSLNSGSELWIALAFSLVYQAAALAVTAVYLLLWTGERRWLAGANRRAWRWVIGGGLATLALAYGAFAEREMRLDDCLDAGGRVTAEGCAYA